MCAIYAFMRYCDDISEGASTRHAKQSTNGARIWTRAFAGDVRRSIPSGQPSTTPSSATKSHISISTR